METHAVTHHNTHQVRNTIFVAAGLVVGFLALMGLCCAFMPTIPLPNY